MHVLYIVKIREVSCRNSQSLDDDFHEMSENAKFLFVYKVDTFDNYSTSIEIVHLKMYKVTFPM